MKRKSTSQHGSRATDPVSCFSSDNLEYRQQQFQASSMTALTATPVKTCKHTSFMSLIKSVEKNKPKIPESRLDYLMLLADRVLESSNLFVKHPLGRGHMKCDAYNQGPI